MFENLLEKQQNKKGNSVAGESESDRSASAATCCRSFQLGISIMFLKSFARWPTRCVVTVTRENSGAIIICILNCFSFFLFRERNPNWNGSETEKAPLEHKTSD